MFELLLFSSPSLIIYMVVQGVRKRYETIPESSNTIENLVRAEVAEEQKNGTSCLVRLVRYVSR